MGGAENLLVDLANCQSASHEVAVIVGNNQASSAILSRLLPGVNLLQVGRPESSRNPFWLAKLLVSIWVIRPDVIHTHHANLVRLKWLLPFPMLVTVHENNVILPDNSSKFSAVCCISEAVKNDLMVRYPRLALCIVYNGIASDAIVPRVSRRVMGKPKLVQVSRLEHEKKGQDILVRAIAKLIKHNEQDVTVDFIGDGPSRSYLEQLAEELGIMSRCRFLGSLPRGEVFSRLGDYDLLVQPSRYEGFGLAVAEAIAAKVPVLVSDIDGPMEIIEHGALGYFFKSEDDDSLVNALLRAINELGNPVMDARLEARRCKIIDKYDVKHTAQEYVNTYREIVNVRKFGKQI